MRHVRLILCLTVILGVYPCCCNAEKIYFNNGEVIEGDILSVGKDYIWIKQEFGKRGIGIKTIDRILDADGTVSKYDYKSAISKIQSFIKKNNYARARELCDSLIEYHRENGQLYYLRAILSQKMGELNKAIADYDFLIEHRLADARVFNNLAAIYAFKKESKEAKDLFMRAIQLDPGIAQAHNNLADLLMREEDYSRAGEEYKKVISLEPENTKALYNLGIVYLKNKDFAQAKENWEKVLEINPSDADAKAAIENIKKLLKAS